MERSLEYMGLTPGTKMTDVQIDKVFIGSCTNSRIEDLRAAATVLAGRKVAANVKHAMVVPGSGVVRNQAVSEGIDKIFIEAGFDWREPGCSMCLGMNPDQLGAQERCASTSNRNFEGRQGKGGRTHLVSPTMAAAAAIAGKLADVREYTAEARKLAAEPSDSKQFLRPAPEPTAPEGPGPLVEAATAAEGMAKFVQLSGVAAPLDMQNVDTDMIIPKQFLKTVKRSGLGTALFDALRYGSDGAELPDFVLNRAPYRDAVVLVAGDNFGCGSSREHAPWALLDFGIRCVISTSFAEIFFNNCFKNGMLPITLAEDVVQRIMAHAEAGGSVAVDLPAQTVTLVGTDAAPITFEVDEFRKHCLVNGLDDIGLTLQKERAITEFEKQRSVACPWLDGPGYVAAQ